MHLYEYVILRYVPRVEREEFFNIGLLMMCKRRRWLRMAVSIDDARLSIFRSPHTKEELQELISALTDVADGKGSCEMHCLEVEERFRWLAAVRSTCLQCSRPHPGLTDDLDTTFDRLFSEYVL